MSCEDSNKILVCTKLYKIIQSYNTVNQTLENTTLIAPLLCEKICPEDYVEKTLDPTKSSQYVTNIVASCEDCFSSSGCEKNQAIFFNKNTCLLEEYNVLSESVAEEMSTDTLVLVDFIKCLSVQLSKADPNLYQSLLLEQQKNSTECLTACCYKLSNGSVGCINVPEMECTIEKIAQSLNSTEVIEVQPSDTLFNKCNSTNCFDQQQDPNFLDYSSKINCGACCLNNNCYSICDVKNGDIQNYLSTTLDIQFDIDEILELLNLSERNDDTISAKEICETLQGVYMGYDTSCNDSLCLKYKIFTK